jgi:glycosyltransferase involved in cell wall biosynthesis
MNEHITVDARMAGLSGIGTYITELLPRVAALWDSARFTVLGNRTELALLLPPAPNVEYRQFDAPIYSIAEQRAFPRATPNDSTLFWAPHYNIPLRLAAPLAVTVHDVNHLAMPQSPPRRLYAKTMFRYVRRRASVVLCNSHFTASEFRRYVGEPRALKVTTLGVAPRWFEPNGDCSPEPGPYFLSVGNVRPHKNLGRLVRAFARVAADLPHRLIIVGRQRGMRTTDSEVVVAATALGDRVSFTGQVAASVLERYVAHCDALVFPSLYEGFGLPALEAMASGRPVAVSNGSAFPEVCGEMAEYFDPLDLASIAAALRRVARHDRDDDQRRARRRSWARNFDWSICAEQTVDALRRAQAGAPGRLAVHSTTSSVESQRFAIPHRSVAP